jgi:hypothetical protein
MTGSGLGRCGLFSLFAGAALAAFVLAPPAAWAEDLMTTARNWGEIHGAAIYCRRKDSDAFGRRAVNWLRGRASGAQFEKLRDTYGLRVIETAHTPPTYAAGGSCAGFDEKYREAKARMGG